MQDLAELDARRSRLMAERGRAILEDAQAILTRDGVAEITARLRHGDIVEAVAEVEAGATLLLIGKRGEAADFAKGHLGSNLERIVRASHRPVLVASRAFRPVDKVLIAFDGGQPVAALVLLHDLVRDHRTGPADDQRRAARHQKPRHQNLPSPQPRFPHHPASCQVIAKSLTSATKSLIN
jgi:hypothetical protein